MKADARSIVATRLSSGTDRDAAFAFGPPNWQVSTPCVPPPIAGDLRPRASRAASLAIFCPIRRKSKHALGVGLLPGHAPSDQLLEGAVGVEQDFASFHEHTLRTVKRGPHQFEHDKDAINRHNPGEGPLHWSARPASFRPRSSPCPGCLTIKQHTQHFSETGQNCSCFVSMIRAWTSRRGERTKSKSDHRVDGRLRVRLHAMHVSRQLGRFRAAGDDVALVADQEVAFPTELKQLQKFPDFEPPMQRVNTMATRRLGSVRTQAFRQ